MLSIIYLILADVGVALAVALNNSGMLGNVLILIGQVQDLPLLNA